MAAHHAGTMKHYIFLKRVQVDTENEVIYLDIEKLLCSASKSYTIV
jgi:hypothetical protein